MRLLKKSYYILKNLGFKVFTKKAIRYPINKIVNVKQKIVENKTKSTRGYKTFNLIFIK
jgi:hypothetical protein